MPVKLLSIDLIYYTTSWASFRCSGAPYGPIFRFYWAIDLNPWFLGFVISLKLSEIFVSSICKKYYIIRFPTLFGMRKNNLKGFVDNVYTALKNNKTLELVAEDLKNSRSGLDELLGKKFSDSLLGDIFSSFCIGK